MPISYPIASSIAFPIAQGIGSGAGGLFDSASFFWGLFKNQSSYSGPALKLYDGASGVDVYFNEGPSEDGNVWISSADVATATENAAGDYDILGWYCQKTGLYLSQSTFSTTTNRIKLTLNDVISGKPAIVFPGAGTNRLWDNTNDGSLTDIFVGDGATILTHVINTATGGTSNKRIFSKGATNGWYYTSSSTMRVIRDYTTTDRVMGVDLSLAGVGFNEWNMLGVRYIEHPSNLGEFVVDGNAWASMTSTTASSGTYVSDSANKFSLGGSPTTGHSFGGAMTFFTIFDGITL